MYVRTIMIQFIMLSQLRKPHINPGWKDTEIVAFDSSLIKLKSVFHKMTE